MKTILITLIILFSLNISAQTVYLVYAEHNHGTRICKIFKTIDKVATTYYNVTGQMLDTTSIFKNNVFFEFRTNEIMFYCEKKRVVIRNGKEKYKTIRRKDFKQKEK